MNMPLVKSLFLLCVLSSTAIAQWNDDGYLPVIGQSGMIDTIYGWKDLQDLGTGMINAGPKPGESYGRVWFTGLDGEPGIIDKAYYYELTGGPNFQLRKARQNGRKLSIKLQFRNIFAPIASQQSRDRLILEGGNVPTIYWQDEQGDYDTSRTTQLLMEDSPTFEYFNSYGKLLYNTYLTSDTVHDIVSVVVRSYRNDKPDSLFAVLYRGGASLKGQKEALPSEIVFMGVYDPLDSWHRYYTQGDWRGSGRNDLITGEIRSKAYFHFRNEPPFSLTNFVRSLAYDTLMFVSDTGGGDVHETLPLLEYALTMRACPRSTSDSSADLIIPTYKLSKGRSLRLFRGHDQFGSNRLTYDSAALTIFPPSDEFGGYGFGDHLRDVGDMTGTGNHVLYVGISQSAGFRAYHLFYVMGNAMDDTADMAYFVEPYGRAWVDTITANSDNLQDVILGIPGYYTQHDLDSGKTDVGTVHVVYGSKKIPVKGKSSVTIVDRDLHTAIYPNPTRGPVTIRFENIESPSVELSILDLLGRKVLQNSYPTFASLQEMTLDVSDLESGTYVLTLTSGDRSSRTILTVLSH